VKYAINTNCLMEQFSTIDIVRMAGKLGFDGIEWGLPEKDYKQAAKDMVKASSDYGLKIAGFLNAGHLWKENLMRSYSEAVAGTGAGYLRVTAPWVAFNYDESLHQKQSFNELFAICRNGLDKLVELGSEYGIKYVIETHMGGLCASPVIGKMLLDGLDPNHVGLLYDPGNGVVEGFIRPRLAIEIMGSYLASIHAKNLRHVWTGLIRKDGPVRAGWSYEISLLDSGYVDWAEMMFAAKVCNFNGWISMEEFFKPEPEKMLKDGLDFLKQCEKESPSGPQSPFSTFND